ncbi:alpha/beta fold hydrolase [Pedobacter sp. SYSU D00535]|uniref:alpha/beta fold hydrolase n=1 Tax=Pedobacter sp. SYSU D00535 TaxID=2810308 RepID=UPI001A97C173|nr:alpha/beta hydrolase [Pedobacter sp. SYSU D00535]
MKFIKSQNPDGSPVNLFYEDWGTGKPVVFIHGWPLDHQMWEYQMSVLPEMGFRCVAYDRRGFGKSDKPWAPYNYDVLADDLKAVLDQLDLHNVTLVGFSMGGGEVVRYMSRHHGARVAKVVLISSITPLTMKTDDNPDGVPPEKLQQILSELQTDRAGFLADFGKQFYGVSWLNHPASQAMLDWNLTVAMQASPKATLDCAHAFAETDFRDEMNSINVPVLIIHGASDETVPIKATSEKAAELIPGAEFIVYEDAPHGLFFTHKQKLNEDLIEFLQVPTRTMAL